MKMEKKFGERSSGHVCTDQGFTAEIAENAE
jgi:hypothetical protein